MARSIVTKLGRSSLPLPQHHDRNYPSLLPTDVDRGGDPLQLNEGVNAPLPRPALDLFSPSTLLPLSLLDIKDLDGTSEFEPCEPSEANELGAQEGREDGTATSGTGGGGEDLPGEVGEGQGVEGIEAAFRGAAGVEVERVLQPAVSNPQTISSPDPRQRDGGRTPREVRTWKLRCSGRSPLVTSLAHASLAVSKLHTSSSCGKVPMSFPPRPPHK